MPAFIVFIAGVLFAIGLALGGMTQPQKIIAFLDVFGDWDPSLAWVMGGAVVTYGLGLRLIVRRKGPVFAQLFQIPTRRDITPSLIIGSVMFGMGWGLGGFCPGPAIASASTGLPMVGVFLGAMLAGMAGFMLLERLRAARASATGSSAT